MKIKVINKSNNSLPKYETSASAGVDIRAHIKEPTVIYPGQSIIVKTGLYVEIPIGYEIQLRPRSGLAAKSGITVLNTPGTIDADYRGEICVILINHHSDDPFEIVDGQRIGQLVANKVEQIQWEQVLELADSERGSGGFGSTGKN